MIDAHQARTIAGYGDTDEIARERDMRVAAQEALVDMTHEADAWRKMALVFSAAFVMITVVAVVLMLRR